MQKEIQVNVHSLSKSYKLYTSRRNRIKEFIDPFRRTYHVKHHALRDVSFSVAKGEVFGVIGENGSGKSTLLKILASVVTPSSGTFSAIGRVTALLELGAGFSHDLSGIENIYYLGAIQGYPRDEMASRLQEILDFADIGEYAYQPVGNYSSGMYVRLAFSLSINIDPDILITDEALAVGDLRFQQKCFRKIREFKDAGKTIIICTHNMSAVKDFCDRAMWLHKGEIREIGDPTFVADCYNAFMTSKEVFIAQESSIHEENGRLDRFNPGVLPAAFQKLIWFDLSTYESYGSAEARILFATLVDASNGQNIRSLEGGEEVTVMLYVVASREVVNPNIELSLNGPFGSTVFKINGSSFSFAFELGPGKPSVLSMKFAFPHLGNGRYTLSLGLQSLTEHEVNLLHLVHDALIIDVFNPDVKYRYGTQVVITHADIQAIV